MEDAHSIVVPFGGVRGQGFFAIFDGHAGKQAAEWCGQNFAVVRGLLFSPSLPQTQRVSSLCLSASSTRCEETYRQQFPMYSTKLSIMST